MLGAGGVALVIVGSILLGRGGFFIVGLVAVLVGIGLVVRTLLQLTETSVGNGSADAGASGTSSSHQGASSLGALVNFQGVKGMSPTSQWTAGAIMGIIALLGLFLFSRAGDGMFALFGGVLFLFGLAVIIVFVHQATDYSSPAAHDAGPAADTTSAGAGPAATPPAPTDTASTADKPEAGQSAA